MRRFTLLTLALAAVGIGLGAGHAQGQQGTLADVWTLVPRAGVGQGFEAALRDHMEWRTEAGDPWQWTVYTVETGPDVGAYVVRSGGRSWADFDAYESDFGPEAGIRVAATFGDMIESVDHRITARDTARTRYAPDMSEINLFTVVNFYPRAGQTQTVNETINKFLAAIVENDLPQYYAFSSVASGSTGPAVITAVFFETNWAGFEDDGALEEAMVEMYGEDEAQAIGEQFGTSIARVEDFVLRVRRDLSMGGS